MSYYYEATGYQDQVLNSSDDYEPYGYLPPESRQQALREWARRSPQLRQAEFVPSHPDRTFDRVIEAQLLAHSSMVGC
ncbi:MAG: hypothetical protein WBG92_02660 [Thiohalocapsa sp.]